MTTPQWRLKQADTQDAPEAGYTTVYAKTDGKLYAHADGGSETEVGGGEGLPDYSGAADGHTLQISGGAPVWSAPSGAALPPGMVVAYAGTSAPSGWLLCDGSAVSRTTYADLYAAIGNAHGSGDGSTTFHLPDYRARMLRGRDGLAGRDPDAASRTAMASGGNTGDAVGSVQNDAFQGHYHNDTTSVSWNNNPPRRTMGGNPDTTTNPDTSRGVVDDATDTNVTVTVSVTSAKTDGTHGTPRTSDETRSKNAYVNFIIKT